MLELLLCSLLTIFPDYLFRRYVQGKRFGKEITFYSVWFELQMGDHGLPDAHRRPDHGGLLQPPVDDKRHIVLPNRPDRSRDDRARRRGLCRHERRGRKGTAALQAGQLEAGGGAWRPRAARSRRSMPDWWSREPTSLEAEGKIQEARSAHQQAWTSWRPSRSCTGATRASSRGATSRSSQVAVDGRQGCDRPPPPLQSRAPRRRYPSLLPAEKASAEAALAAGRGGAGEDGHPCRRRRAGGAVPSARRRRRQSDDAPGRRPDPGGCRPAKRCRPASDRSRRRS